MSAPGYRLGRCPVTGKAQYTTRRVAKRVARNFPDGGSPFKCQHCGFHHVGHLSGLSRAEHREYHANKGRPATGGSSI